MGDLCVAMPPAASDLHDLSSYAWKNNINPVAVSFPFLLIFQQIVILDQSTVNIVTAVFEMSTKTESKHQNGW